MELVFTIETVQIHQDAHGIQVSYFLTHRQECDVGKVETASDAQNSGPSAAITINMPHNGKPTLPVGRKAKLIFDKE